MGWDPVWEKVFTENEWGKYPDESFIRFVARHYYRMQRSDVRVLEVGCGPGANIWYLSREGFDTYGIEGSQTAVEHARARLKAEGVKADLRVGDIMKLPYEDNFFDAVADNACITHNSRKDTETILSEIKRVLKPGGRFYSRTFSDSVYLGKSRVEKAPGEYQEVSDGPFAGRGFVRVASQNEVKALYGKYFQIVSLDYRDYSVNHQTMKISEWILYAQKQTSAS
jgi:SAM-dependent methyltransferase